VLGSLKYAVENLGGSLKLIVALGHSGCGALTTAVDVFLNPSDYLPLATKHTLRGILDRSLLVVQTSARKLLAAYGPDVVLRPGYRKALVETAIVTNAALAAYSIQEELRSNELTEIRAVYGVYLLDTRQIWAPRVGSIEGGGWRRHLWISQNSPNWARRLCNRVALGPLSTRALAASDCIRSLTVFGYSVGFRQWYKKQRNIKLFQAQWASSRELGRRRWLWLL